MIEEPLKGVAVQNHASPAALANQKPEEACPPLEIVAMSEEDIPRILEIEREGQPEPWSGELFREELHRVHAQAMVVRVGGGERSPVGYICFWEVAGEIQILNVAVHKDYRRRGIGRALMQHALRYGLDRNARTASLELRRSNVAARRLYEGMGFRVVGERPNYYGLRETAIIMELELDSTVP